MPVFRERGAVPCFVSQQRPWPHGHRLRPSRPQTLREQVTEAANGAGDHDENGPGEPGQERRTVGCPEVQQAEDVEDDHEQDAEQDRNQHDGCRETFHIANVTPPGCAPIRPVPYFISLAVMARRSLPRDTDGRSLLDVRFVQDLGRLARGSLSRALRPANEEDHAATHPRHPPCGR